MEYQFLLLFHIVSATIEEVVAVTPQHPAIHYFRVRNPLATTTAQEEIADLALPTRILQELLAVTALGQWLWRNFLIGIKPAPYKSMVAFTKNPTFLIYFQSLSDFLHFFFIAHQNIFENCIVLLMLASRGVDT